jgi:hypothetical protein
MLKFNPTTPMQLYYAKDGTYTAGSGATRSWELIESGDYDTFYGEWKGTYGDRALAAESLGVKDSATVRTFYNPDIYEKLRSCRVIVVKNADSDAVSAGVPDRTNPNVYELWGGVDNVMEENQFMEFRVRRYEGV